MSNRTAVEWLKENLENYGTPSHLIIDWDTLDKLCDQAKEMDKEQIVDAMDEGFNDGIRVGQFLEPAKFSSGEQYFNKTYGGNK